MFESAIMRTPADAGLDVLLGDVAGLAAKPGRARLSHAATTSPIAIVSNRIPGSRASSAASSLECGGGDRGGERDAGQVLRAERRRGDRPDDGGVDAADRATSPRLNPLFSA